MRELRPAYLPVDPVSRTVYEPGELAQCDLWFPEADIPLGYGQSGRPPVLVIVSGYSRMITARMLPSRQTNDLIDGHWRLLTGWGAVPTALVRDNEPGVGRGRPTSEFAALAGLLATRIHFCRLRDPEAKGLVERANGYLETSFLPGRTFVGPGDFNAQLAAWLQNANRCRHGTIDARPDWCPVAHAEQPSTRRRSGCEDCQAGPDSGDIRITSIGRDRTVTETWHTDQCSTYWPLRRPADLD
ncbi:hypothetical protein [Kitasatospora sp. NPDC056531]|uniref:hypothetical protein n=1 Tax=Kitasatospora sp. NPDC056531 TaxID=3345856 RepID=UPI003673CFC5